MIGDRAPEPVRTYRTKSGHSEPAPPAALSFAPIVPLLTSVVVLVLGSGLQGTVLGLRAGIEGFAAMEVGAMMSGHFLGFSIGARYAPRLVGRVGYVQAFAAMASIGSAAPLAHAFWASPMAWIILRILSGLCYAGLVLIIECWLNAHALRRTRGRLLAVYGTLMMAAWGASQLLINVADPGGYELLSISSILISLALVPLVVSCTTIPPVPARTPRLRLRQLYATSPLGVIGAFVGGTAMSAFWGMGPTFSRGIGLNTFDTSLFLASPMLGALVLQPAVGWLSDRYDRRIVILWVSLSTAAPASGLALSTDQDIVILVALGFAFGGCGLSLYALSVAHANDHIGEGDLVPLASSLLLLYGLGAAVGPIAASLVMGLAGPMGLFIFISTVEIALLLFGILRSWIRRPAEDQQEFVAIPSAGVMPTHAAIELDPRINDE